MRRDTRRREFFVISALLTGLVGGCSDAGALGTERNGCLPDKRCEAGLVCLSGLCVDPGDGGDTDTSASDADASGSDVDTVADTSDTADTDTRPQSDTEGDALVRDTSDARPEVNLPEGPLYTVADGCGRPTNLAYPDCAGVTCEEGERCMGAGLCLPAKAVALPSFVGAQSAPSLAVRDDGAWAVAYYSGTIPDGVMHVWVQVFADGGLTSSAPLMLDDDESPRFNRTPSIAVLDNGSWFVVWRSEGVLASDLTFRGRVVSGDGARASGPSFPVSETPFTNGGGSTNVDAPIAVTLRKGGVLVAWPAQALDSNVLGVYARRIGGQGGLLGREIDTGATVPGVAALSPAIAPLPAGGAVLLWQSQDLRGDVKEDPEPPVIVRGRRFDSVGLPQGEVFDVTTSAFAYEALPNVTALDDTRLLVSWKTALVSTVTTAVDIRARRFPLTATALGGVGAGVEHLVGRDPSGLVPDQAATITLVGDRALVAWHSPDTDVNAVFGRRYYPAEDVFDCELTNLTDGTVPVGPILPSAIAFPDGRVLVAWNSGIQPNVKTFLRFLPY